MLNFYQSAKELARNKQLSAFSLASVAMMTSGKASSSDFFTPFCAALSFFTGKSPLVAFLLMAGGFGLLVGLLVGEDKGMLMSVVKWIAGGAGIMGLSTVIAQFFPALNACPAIG